MEEHELRIITEISKNSVASQRHLSKVSDLSLGMVNIILHRLIEKGYMKIKQLDGRKVQYLLTPKGFSEKFEKSRQYLQTTISRMTKIKDSIKEIVLLEYDKGHKKIVVVGGNDLSHVVDMALKEIKKEDMVIVHSLNADEIEGDCFVIYTGDNHYTGRHKNHIDISVKLAEIII